MTGIRTGVSYYGNRSLLSVPDDLRRIRRNHVTYVVHTFSENDLYFYKDTMKEIFRLTKREGLEVQADPWGVLGLFGGESFSDLANHRNDIRQVLSDGRSAAAACPNNPATMKLMKQWIDAMASCGAETIFWDEPHFYLPGWYGRKEPRTLHGCYCATCRGLFKDAGLGDLKSASKEARKKFQDDCLLRFLRTVIRHCSRLGLKSSVCVLPHKDARDRGFWARVAAIPGIVSLGTDPYWSSAGPAATKKHLNGFFSESARALVELARGQEWEPHLWIQNFRIRRGRESDIEDAVRIAAEQGIRDIAAWSYYGGFFMSSLAADDPAAVWRALGRSFARLHHARR